MEPKTVGQGAMELAARLNATAQQTPPSEVSTPSPEPVCPVCRGSGFLRYDVPPGDPNFGKIMPCPDVSHNESRAKKLAKISHLNADELGIRLGDIRPTTGNRAMLAACRKVLDNPRGWLYIHGGPGNAKSVALMAMVNEINAIGCGPAMYIKFTDLLNWMRDAFREKKMRDENPATLLGYIDRFNRIKAIKFIAIDEFDKARSTEFAAEFRFDFLDERYRSGVTGATVTVFAGNTGPELLPPAIYDRIRDGRFAIAENTEKSARQFMGWG